MIAAEEKEVTGEKAGGANMKKSARWLWPMLVFSDVVFLGLVAYFLVSKPRSDLHSLVRFIDVHFTWIAAAMGAFIAVALFFAVVKSKQPVEELVLLAKQLGWTLERRWGFHGGFGALSLFGCGPYFRVSHRGLTLAFCPIVDEDSRELGLRVTAFHNRPLGLGLMLKTGVGLFMEGRTDDKYRGILTKRLEIPVENVRVWAANTEKARDLLSDAPILNCLDSLKQELDSLNEEAESRLISRSSGVVIRDRSISLLLSKNHHLHRNLVDAICDLSLALSCAEVVPALPSSKTGDRIYRSVLVTLIALVIASLIWVLTDYIRGVL
jgi:hypothetical protein